MRPVYHVCCGSARAPGCYYQVMEQNLTKENAVRKGLIFLDRTAEVHLSDEARYAAAAAWFLAALHLESAPVVERVPTPADEVALATANFLNSPSPEAFDTMREKVNGWVISLGPLEP